LTVKLTLLAIHASHPRNSLTHLLEADLYLDLYYGVPDSWGFLIFCAGWTVLIVVFERIAERKFGGILWVRYLCVAAETVAVLSWLAGFVAVAVRISGHECSTGEKSCGSLVAATVFGALECLLFTITTFTAALVAFNSPRMRRSLPDKRDALP
jgi:hypothetical protein